ncbi:MAG: SDR family oxidoreductase [Candidatus Promineofilum sp.]|nr:SDR family oxidoreductase [Promineifilum sp.]MBP9656217.1 SDR family oxidoreductase [Promineifilum sp.]
MATGASFDLTDKVALITGGSRGIGLAIAQAFAVAGAKVVLASRRQEAVDEAAEIVRGVGGEVLAVAAHTGDSAAVTSLVERAADHFGGIDILVNNAATNPHFGTFLSAEDSHWDKILEVNVKGYFRVAKACVPLMRARGGGKIINMASVAGLEPQPMMGVYCVSKAAVLMMTEVMAAEVAADNIQVNAIAPGFVKTKFSQVLWSTPQIHDSLVQSVPQRRMADPEEIAGAAVFLASAASSFMTGATLVVDGGQLIGGVSIG